MITGELTANREFLPSESVVKMGSLQQKDRTCERNTQCPRSTANIKASEIGKKSVGHWVVKSNGF